MFRPSQAILRGSIYTFSQLYSFKGQQATYKVYIMELYLMV
jgi:hypothetical protein